MQPMRSMQPMRAMRAMQPMRGMRASPVRPGYGGLGCPLGGIVPLEVGGHFAG
jgi:hypothetical protein